MKSKVSVLSCSCQIHVSFSLFSENIKNIFSFKFLGVVSSDPRSRFLASSVLGCGEATIVASAMISQQATPSRLRRAGGAVQCCNRVKSYLERK